MRLPYASFLLLSLAACQPEPVQGPTAEQLRQEASAVMAVWSLAIAAGDFRTACTAWTSTGSPELGRYCLDQAGRMTPNDRGYISSVHRGGYVRSVVLDDDCHAHTAYHVCASAYFTSSQFGNGETSRFVLVRETTGWKLANPTFFMTNWPPR